VRIQKGSGEGGTSKDKRETPSFEKNLSPNLNTKVILGKERCKEEEPKSHSVQKVNYKERCRKSAKR